MGEKCASCRSARNANNSQTLGCLFSLKSKQRAKQTLIFPLPFFCSVESVWTFILLQLHCPLVSSIFMASCCSSTPFTSVFHLTIAILCLCCPDASSNSLVQKFAFMPRSWKTLPHRELFTAVLLWYIRGILSPFGLTWVCRDNDLLNAREGGCCTFEVLCCSSLVMAGIQQLRTRTSQLLICYELLFPRCVISSNLHTPCYFAFLIGPTHYGTVGQLMGTRQKAVRKKQTLPKLQSLLPSHHQRGPWCGWYHLQIVDCLIHWTQRSVISCNAGNRQDTEGVKLSVL